MLRYALFVKQEPTVTQIMLIPVLPVLLDIQHHKKAVTKAPSVQVRKILKPFLNDCATADTCLMSMKVIFVTRPHLF